jgi:protein required for attachment to host cells
VLAQNTVDQVVLIAPPRALGHLRGALSSAAAKKVIGSDAHDRVDATIITLESVVHAARHAHAA